MVYLLFFHGQIKKEKKVEKRRKTHGEKFISDKGEGDEVISQPPLYLCLLFLIVLRFVHMIPVAIICYDAGIMTGQLISDMSIVTGVIYSQISLTSWRS